MAKVGSGVIVYLCISQFQLRPSLPGQWGAFVRLLVPTAGHLQLRAHLAGHLSISGYYLGHLSLTEKRPRQRVPFVIRQNGQLYRKDESFVTSWLTKEGLDRLVDIFKGRLSCFSSNIINIFVFNNIKTLLVFNCFEFELVCVYVNLYFISVRFTMS